MNGKKVALYLVTIHMIRLNSDSQNFTITNCKCSISPTPNQIVKSMFGSTPREVRGRPSYHCTYGKRERRSWYLVTVSPLGELANMYAVPTEDNGTLSLTYLEQVLFQKIYMKHLKQLKTASYTTNVTTVRLVTSEAQKLLSLPIDRWTKLNSQEIVGDFTE